MNRIRVARASDGDYLNVLDGVERKTLVYCKNTLMTEFILAKGKLLPMHRHPQEQTGYLISGHIILTIDDAKYDMKPGDSWAIPGDVDHGAEIIEDSVAIEIFSPVRSDYLP